MERGRSNDNGTKNDGRTDEVSKRRCELAGRIEAAPEFGERNSGNGGDASGDAFRYVSRKPEETRAECDESIAQERGEDPTTAFR